MTSAEQKYDLVLFGVLGDLSRRKLLPALYQLERANLLDENSLIVGVAREELTEKQFQQEVKASLQRFIPVAEFDDSIWLRMAERLRYCELDLADSDGFQKLPSVLNNENNNSSRSVMSYLAVPPSLFAQVCKGLESIGYASSPSRVVLEKPLGHDFESSVEINDEVARYFDEEQIYRIDHYLGKETVLNLMALRFANPIFSSQWSRKYIDHIQITAAEQVGVEGRWSYYDDAGQLRDMVQNHLLQVLALVAMEPPTQLDAECVRDEKVKVLRSLRAITTENVNEDVVRGQYAAGFVNDQKVPAYLDEEGARKASDTETFVALKAHIDNWRWANVPFYLRTGKRMANKCTEIVISFKPQPHNIFKDSIGNLSPNRLIIRLQPDEGIEIEMMNKVPGLGKQMELKSTTLDLSFDETFKNNRISDAYERLLLEAFQGHQYLFVAREEVEYAWRWIDSIRKAWQQSGEKPKPYKAGSWGPVASVSLMAQEGREWEDDV
ncbi:MULTISPECIES: glucose-6-phosphate dehydrogenase [Gammaproteobacteria]|uniref:glucose-6-phosphate dehydrogenase n=1 Tax=Gammaproteobacteria TaxID=1236 RepID=UPI000DD0B406|nr:MULTISPECIES: glucose-6-phosphate dehydrogenase [Gammaproteobacteria]RTE86283.1 glucose-6-phosphate dehydrogenase [Aliidiomarina sp. B3213]TCZ91634.1 glucose-6-phosphate dehydrogenase [Lysobacter sp. N42]